MPIDPSDPLWLSISEVFDAEGFELKGPLYFWPLQYTDDSYAIDIHDGNLIVCILSDGLFNMNAFKVVLADPKCIEKAVEFLKKKQKVVRKRDWGLSRFWKR
jgi:hypothetical protein